MYLLLVPGQVGGSFGQRDPFMEVERDCADRQRALSSQQGDPGVHRKDAGATNVPWTILVRDGAGGEALCLHKGPRSEPAAEQGLLQVSVPSPVILSV